ncbi:MAG: globin [Woeseiaceae bacterium]
MNPPTTLISNSEGVKSCWSKIIKAKGKNNFVGTFYQSMFEYHPEIQALFPQNLKSQKESLITTLDNVINGIEFIDTLEEELYALGERHISYGIKAEMFEDFISIIVSTADEASDYTASKDELAAWEEAFRQISNLMLKAYK